ncbi:MAG: Na(+)-translocating NADH-quinone reductase subunit A [Melioribacteraceae bacterium]|nr:Na(+)-translocating NADH-quinone reductase subunit A [Melioribacteraceae bacterium]MCF8355286.1 Na(+)-translocating NADH-quinone reductase subunit A [Melioribacteraceae bacterium]MCF8394132.1 Na(+)-translocating NADH-quinone reductase subunit A [Melioribacteraceae bacterium]MCF8418129.1 Na(+)-translocating NADH-quinone reductase subunit A [Melioribacteraceae bacterium]
MARLKLKKGLDIPIKGKPVQEVSDAASVKRVAILGNDYVGMKPTMIVQEGDVVKLGQPVFTDKKNPLVKYTSPGNGKVVEINRGEKRVFLSMVIELSGNEEIEFPAASQSELKNLKREDVIERLINSGEWTSIRVRPFSKVADPETIPHAIFVTAMDTNPFAPSLEKIISLNENHFKNGLSVISKLTEGKVFVCKDSDSKIPVIDSAQISVEEFDGPHPAGNVGTHIHFLSPVGRKRFVWHLSAQDVIAIGHLFTTGKIMVDRVVSLAGSSVKNPRLIKTRRGASITELISNEVKDDNYRAISGSVLSGRNASDAEAYLGRFHQQISVIPNPAKRKFLGWLNPFVNNYSMKNIVFSKLAISKEYEFSTEIHGGKRAIVPSGNFEQLMPMDIIPTYLLRALAVNDVEEAEQLGVLELDEEDLALCTFSCPSKLEYGPMLRENLTIIEKEG